jgi:predicted kinase
VLRSDVERKAMYGMAETDPLPAEAYTAEATGRVYATLAEKARRAIAAGHSALVDAVFARLDERRNIAAAASGAGFRGLFLTADLAARVARVSARSGDASDADAEIVRQQERYGIGALEWTEIDASGKPEDTLRHARAALAR